MDRFDFQRSWWKIILGISVFFFILGIVLIATSGPSAKATVKISTPTSYLWPEARVPYTFDSGVESALKIEIEDALKSINEKTCIKIVKKEQRDKYWITFVRNNAECYNSELGLDTSKEGKKEIQFSQFCFTQSLVQMLLGRTLGLDFEETRPDREKFLQLEASCETVSTPTRNISIIIPNGNHKDPALEIFFDYSSLMLRNSECLEPTMNGRFNIGSGANYNAGPNGTFSPLDIEKLNAIYNCTGCNSYRFLSSEKLLNSTGRMTSTFDSFKPVIGGLEIDGRTDLYICRVYQRGALLIGKVTTDKSKNNLMTCWVEDRRQEHSYDDSFEFLTNPGGANLQWKIKIGLNIPSNAVVGGVTENREPVYIGRCRITFMGGDTTVTGSIFPNVQVMKVPFNNMASPCPRTRPIEILVCEE